MKDDIKKILENEKSSGYKFETIDKERILFELIKHIGNLDSYIRDSLVYPCLAHLLHDNHLDKNKLNEITRLFISNDYLFYDIENKEEYSVLKRSFTTLQLVILVYVNNRDNVFEEGLFEEVIDKFFKYFESEKNYIGFKEEVGWMHSIAHSADLFGQIFKAKELKASQAEAALNLIKDKFLIYDYNYISDEDERMTTAIVSLVNRNIVSKEFWLEWLEGFNQFTKPKDYPLIYFLKNNRKNLLRSLYFRLIDNKENQYLVSALKNKIIDNEGMR